jgi:SpoVK/Ycf46/Vps4 family AAA+-type ATPase
MNGPKILSKFVGASEENIRKLFAEARKSIRKKVMKVVCILSFLANWMPFLNNVGR